MPVARLVSPDRLSRLQFKERLAREIHSRVTGFSGREAQFYPLPQNNSPAFFLHFLLEVPRISINIGGK
jgi:hypothetical protein